MYERNVIRDKKSIKEAFDKHFDPLENKINSISQSIEYHPSLLNAYKLKMNKDIQDIINDSEQPLEYKSFFKFLDFYARLSDPKYKVTNEEINYYYNYIRSRMLSISYFYEQHAIDYGDVDEEEELLEISEKAKTLSKSVENTRLDKILYIESITDFEHTTGSIIPLIFNISDYGDADYWAKRLLDYLRKN